MLKRESGEPDGGGLTVPSSVVIFGVSPIVLFG